MSFEIPPDNELDPSRIYERLIAECPELGHLAEHEPKIAFMYRLAEKIKAGKQVLGTCYMPAVQGDLKPMFDWLLEEKLGYWPDYLITLDHGFWTECSPRDRDALLFHELLHTGIAVDKYGEERFDKETGDPVWAIKAHDVEAFNAEVARFGAWKSDIAAFLEAAGAGS